MKRELTVEWIDGLPLDPMDLSLKQWKLVRAAARAWLEHEQSDWSGAVRGHFYKPERHDTDGAPYVVEREEWKPTHKHIKSGGLYRVVAYAKIEADLSPAVVYESGPEHGRETWIRPHTEFHDGRFEPLTASPSAEPEREEIPCPICGRLGNGLPSMCECHPTASPSPCVHSDGDQFPPWCDTHNKRWGTCSPSACVSGEDIERFSLLSGDNKNALIEILRDALAQCRAQEAACRSDLAELTSIHNANHDRVIELAAELAACRAEVERLKIDLALNIKEADGAGALNAEIERLKDYKWYEESLRLRSELAAKQDYIRKLESEYNAYIMQHSPETVPACTVTALRDELALSKSRVERLEGALKAIREYGGDTWCGNDCPDRARIALTEAEAKP